MHRVVSLYFQDGELVEYQLCETETHNSCLELYQKELLDIDFIFFDSDGTPLPLWFSDDPFKVQILLTCHDRLLASLEQTNCQLTDEYGSSVLPLKALAFDNRFVRDILAGKTDNSSPVDCEFSMAIYAGNTPGVNMQLFFTFKASLIAGRKNTM